MHQHAIEAVGGARARAALRGAKRCEVEPLGEGDCTTNLAESVTAVTEALELAGEGDGGGSACARLSE